MAEDKNLHKGHRQRMLKRYLEHGIDCFEEHEILEIFLYSAYSRRNTNDISHKLINRFGSLEGVLGAGYDELKQVDDVGVTAAALITFMKDMLRKYSKDDFAGIKLDTSDRMRDFCVTLFEGEKVECCRALFLDSSMNLVSEAVVVRGNDFSADFDMRHIVTKAVQTHSTNVVLTHCHPDGVALPSSKDVSATRRAAQLLGSIGITLNDHIIVSEGVSYSMRVAGMLPDIWEKNDSDEDFR